MKIIKNNPLKALLLAFGMAVGVGAGANHVVTTLDQEEKGCVPAHGATVAQTANNQCAPGFKAL